MSFQLPNTHTFVLPLVIDFYLLMNIDKEEHMTAKLQVQHLTKIFGRRIQRAEELVKEGKSKAEILKSVGATVGVNDANFEVNDGEIFVIMGLSGSGKSTMIRMIKPFN
jgi:ABC-type proline/glycine betaine transport system ATPase subunit